jgi:hypothetical protein
MVTPNRFIGTAQRVEDRQQMMLLCSGWDCSGWFRERVGCSLLLDEHVIYLGHTVGVAENNTMFLVNGWFTTQNCVRDDFLWICRNIPQFLLTYHPSSYDDPRADGRIPRIGGSPLDGWDPEVWCLPVLWLQWSSPKYWWLVLLSFTISIYIYISLYIHDVPIKEAFFLVKSPLFITMSSLSSPFPSADRLTFSPFPGRCLF